MINGKSEKKGMFVCIGFFLVVVLCKAQWTFLAYSLQGGSRKKGSEWISFYCLCAMQPSSLIIFYSYKKPHVVNFLLYCLWILFDLGNIKYFLWRGLVYFFFWVVPKCSTVIFITIWVFYSSASAPRDTSFITDYLPPLHMGVWVISIWNIGRN